MSWTAAGSYGAIAVGLSVVGAIIQLALAGILAQGRRVPVVLALLCPALVLGLGLAGASRNFAEALRAIRQASDPAYAPWFAIYDRAAAPAPLVVGALASALLVLPVLVGAGIGGLRGGKRGSFGPVVAAGTSLAAAIGLFVAAIDLGRVDTLPVAALVLALAGAAGAGTLASVRPERLSGVGVATLGTLLVGCALAAAAWALEERRFSDALADVSLPFAMLDAFRAGRDDPARVGGSIAVATAVAVLGALPGLALVRPRRIDAKSALDVVCTFVLVTSLLLGGGWTWARRHALSRAAGVHATAVLRAAPGYPVARAAVLPPRVLLADARAPKWISMKEDGGLSVEPIVGGLERIGPLLAKGDGLLLPLATTALDLYLLLLESPAGSIAIVGCETVPGYSTAAIESDPLLAVGACASFPLRLRVTDALEERRSLIVLKDQFVDDGGNVIALAELSDLEGRDVVLRLQADANVSDLVVAMKAMEKARRVYLGWGVDIDGSSIPVGVDPQLRIGAR